VFCPIPGGLAKGEATVSVAVDEYAVGIHREMYVSVIEIDISVFFIGVLFVG